MTDQPIVTLNDGVSMPQFGLGVFQTPPGTTAEVVRQAIADGYRLVDTAAMYRNEEGVGEALREAGQMFRDDQARQRRSRLRHRASRFRLERQAAQARADRPLSDPLAAAPRRPLCRDMEGAGSSQTGGPDPVDRRIQFQPRPPGADHRRDRRHALGQSDRASPALPAAGLARLSRRKRHQDRIVEPARTGHFSRRSRDRRHRGKAWQDGGAGRDPLAPG